MEEEGEVRGEGEEGEEGEGGEVVEGEGVRGEGEDLVNFAIRRDWTMLRGHDLI